MAYVIGRHLMNLYWEFSSVVMVTSLITNKKLEDRQLVSEILN